MESAWDYAGALISPSDEVLASTLLNGTAHPFVQGAGNSSWHVLGQCSDRSWSLGSRGDGTLEALVITTRLVTLVLEEDGTVVDTEEFFQTLGDNTHFMVLEKGQKWTPGSNYVPVHQQPKKSGIAKVTFDLYKLNPKDVIGCLNVKATIYEIYSVSYDIQCTGLKSTLRCLLRLMSHVAQVTGQFLICIGTYMLRVLGDTEEQAAPKSRPKRGFMWD
ncbi:PREDICTED: cell death activator CIDE-A [Condylura cristata]|uniref:cell death activator CIDE-A n=1 Tax=Condylura cristata TaxID=143302 RepID=UPI0003346C2D|nr:PREDICTED: cell death activator CIDE-A [Condylura cristata]